MFTLECYVFADISLAYVGTPQDVLDCIKDDSEVAGYRLTEWKSGRPIDYNTYTNKYYLTLALQELAKE